MSRLAIPCLLACAAFTLGAAGARAGGTAGGAGSSPASGADLAPRCPPGAIPDGPGLAAVCVRLPSSDPGVPESPSFENTHRDRSGRWSAYDQIPRRPERPADYDRYVYPVPAPPGGHYVASGYDLDKPDEQQRRGPHLSHVGHGGVDIPEPIGTPITLVALDKQDGPAEVVFVGDLFGRTVITRHTVREGGRARTYLLLFGHLSGPAPGLARGTPLQAGDLVGMTGETSTEGFPHLHLEARRVREGVDLAKHAGGGLIVNEVSVVCDPRNVLPVR